MISQEDKKLRDYELVVIVSPEEAVEGLIERISRFVTENGGSITSVDRWGKRKLAYPIKHFMEGSYVLARFKLRPRLSRELEANLKISEEVLRHLLTRLSA